MWIWDREICNRMSISRNVLNLSKFFPLPTYKIAGSMFLAKNSDFHNCLPSHSSDNTPSAEESESNSRSVGNPIGLDVLRARKAVLRCVATIDDSHAHWRMMDIVNALFQRSHLAGHRSATAHKCTGAHKYIHTHTHTFLPLLSLTRVSGRYTTDMNDKP